MNERIFHGDIERLRAPQRVTLLEVERVVDAALAGAQIKNVLDIGTGSGIFAEAFAARGLTVAGIDTNPKMIETARQFVPTGDFRQAPAEAIPFGDATFDLVLFSLVLHETDDYAQALSEAHRVARARVAVLEWAYREEEHGPQLEHRLSPEQLTGFAHAAGFSKIEWVPLTHLVLALLER